MIYYTTIYLYLAGAFIAGTANYEDGWRARIVASLGWPVVLPFVIIWMWMENRGTRKGKWM